MRRGYKDRACIIPATRTSLLPPLFPSLPRTDAYRTLPPHPSMVRTKREVQPLRRSTRIPSKPKLPLKPPSICEPCRKGPFAAQLGLFRPEGYSYFVRRSQINQRASFGCVWCKCLRDKLPLQDQSNRTKPEGRLKITLTTAKVESDFTPIDTQMLEVLWSDSDTKPLPLLCSFLTTSSGESSNYMQRT